MGSVLGFLLVNIYAFLLIFATTVVFFSKKRLKEVEDETYKKFLIANIVMSISGLVLGLAVSPGFYVNDLLVIILNKLYLVSLMWWIGILSFYYFYITFKNRANVLKDKKIFDIINIVSTVLIVLLPISVDVTPNGAVAGGLSIMFTYTVFGIAFLFQIVCVLINYKNFKNKKYVPLYVLVGLGSIVLIGMMVNPTLNYIINPMFIFIAFIMYHTIENPDMQMIDTLLRNKELVEQSVNDKSNYLFKISQEMKKPIKNIISNSKLYKNANNEEEKETLIGLIERDANNAYFIINDISSISSADVKKIKMYDNKYMTKKFFTDIEVTARNQLSYNKKDSDIEFNFKLFSKCPEYLYGDNIKLKQVLLSIISNSIKYTESGFIDIEVDSITRYDICRLVFTIKDSGHGMSINKINEILSSNDDVSMEKFQQNDSLDLEMPIAIKILKMLGGSISIKSSEGKGSIVVIVVDQKIENSKEEKLLEDVKKYKSGVKAKKRVLVADDTSNLEKIERLLLKYDVDVISTLVGRECIDKINSGDNFDLIILKDDMKPDNAYMILKELKENKKFKIPVVIMIDKDKEFIKDHFMNDGFSECIIYENIDNEIKKIADKYL